MNLRSNTVSMLVLGMMLASAVKLNAREKYVITDLGQARSVDGFNDLGHAIFRAGDASLPPGLVIPGSIRYYDGSTVSPLPGRITSFLPEDINALNNRGQSVGSYKDTSSQLESNSPERATIRSGDLTILALGNSKFTSRATTIDQAGLRIAGIMGQTQQDGTGVAFRYELDSSEMPESLGTLGGEWSEATDINEAGVVVGSASTGADPDSITTTGTIVAVEAYFYDTEIHGLGTLGGNFSAATAINDHGHIVGESATSFGRKFAFEYTKELGMQRVLQNEFSSGAYDINNAGQIVGTLIDSEGIGQAFIRTQKDAVVQLFEQAKDSGPWSQLHEARFINERGQVLGLGIIDHQVHAFIASPVPEPSTWMLVAIGTILVPRSRRATPRRNQRPKRTCQPVTTAEASGVGL